MISIILYGRNDNYGFNLHKRAAISLNCMAEVLVDPEDEILFVDYNTPSDFPTFPESIQDTLTKKARERLRILRVRPHIHDRFRNETHLVALEPISRNIAVRRSNPANRWILSTNTDLIFLPQIGDNLSDIARDLPDGFYHAPRIEIPETLWESLDRTKPVEVIETVRQWGWDIHLNEIVYGSENILYDGPGDFQLIKRQDLFDYHGFDERMLLGWHVDSNISKRLRLVYGRVGDLGEKVFGYHCDHTRQITPMHSHTRTENDWRFFIDNVDRPDIPSQADDWGCARDEIEEIRLADDGSRRYVEALKEAIGAPITEPIIAHYDGEHYGDSNYDVQHVIPFLVDLFVSAPKNFCIGWFGAQAEPLKVFAQAWKALGFKGKILVNPDLCDPQAIAEMPFVTVATEATLHQNADAFIFDFGGVPFHPKSDGAEDQKKKRATILQDFVRAVKNDRERRVAGKPLRQFVTIGTIHNDWENVVKSHLACGHTPYSTRMRHGYVLPTLRKKENWLQILSVGEAGLRAQGKLSSVDGKIGCVAFGPHRYLGAGAFQLNVAFELNEPFCEDTADEICLAVEMRCASRIVNIWSFRRRELDEVAHTLKFGLDDFISDNEPAAVEMRLMVISPIKFSMTRLEIEGIDEDIENEEGETSLTRLEDWLPLLRVGDIGERTISGVHARKGDGGYIVDGPYWPLPPGRYQVTFQLQTDADEADLKAPIGSLDVAADTDIIAFWEIFPKDLAEGEVSLLFELPDRNDDEAPSPAVETRVHSSGAIPLTVTSVRVVSCEKHNWLPGVIPEGHGERDGAVIRTTDAKIGSFANGPFKHLNAGRYRLEFRIVMPEFSDTGDSNRTYALMEVWASGRMLAFHACTLEQLAADENSLVFDVPKNVGATPNTTVDVRVFAAIPTPMRLSHLSIERADDADLNANGFGLTLLDDWLPLLRLGGAGEWSMRGVETRNGASGYLVAGPHWPLPPGAYEASFVLETQSGILRGNSKLATIDVAADAKILAARKIVAKDLKAGVLRLPFEVPNRGNGVLAPAIETRVHSSGGAALTVKSVRVRARGAAG